MQLRPAYRGFLSHAGLVTSIGLTGCATPPGVLFPPLDPPVVWPASPEPPRIKLIGAFSNSADLKVAPSTVEAIKTVLRGPRPPIGFSGPTGVAIRPPGVVAVADGTGGAVHVIDFEHRTHRMITGFGGVRFLLPFGVAWAQDRLLVTDAQRHEVVELNADGALRRRFGGDVLQRPVGIAYVPSRDQVYVVDGDAHRVCVFDRDGNLVRTFGSRGVKPGAFNFPTHISCRGDRLLVADSGNFRVQVLDLDGRSLGTIGEQGDAAGDLALPKGVAFDHDGHVYVVDARFENVQIFDTHGQLLLAFGEEGSGLGQFSLPAGIAIDEDNRIWVADAGNRRLEAFEYLEAP